MERCIHVPSLEESRAMRVEECNRRWKSVVMVDDVGQVGHGFMALVHRGGEGEI